MEEGFFSNDLSSFISIPLNINIDSEVEENKKLLEKGGILVSGWIEGMSDFIGDYSYPRVCTVTIGNRITLPSTKGRTSFIDSRISFYGSTVDKLNWVASYIVDYILKNKKYPTIKRVFEDILYWSLSALKIDYDYSIEGRVDSSKWNVEKLENPEYLKNFIFSEEGYIVKGSKPIIKDTVNREILEKIV